MLFLFFCVHIYFTPFRVQEYVRTPFSAHKGFVYNSGYGLDLINNSGSFMNMLYGTIWQVDQSLIDDFKNKIKLGFEPIIVNGIVSDTVSGRGLGRGIYYGDVIPKALISVAQFSSEPFKTELMAFAKEASLKNGTENAATNDNTIIERGPVTKFKRYVMGDKVVYSGKDFGFGLGMFSSRINSFERNLGEVKKAWYCNSGALYIMNRDITQHDNNWWIAVNHYRIPGTTVDTIPRETDRFEGVSMSPYAWVSSIDFDETYGCAGFTNYNFYSTLNSLKITANVNDLKGKKLVLLVSKQQCDFNPDVFSGGIYYNDDSKAALIDNRISTDFEVIF